MWFRSVLILLLDGSSGFCSCDSVIQICSDFTVLILVWKLNWCIDFHPYGFLFVEKVYHKVTVIHDHIVFLLTSLIHLNNGFSVSYLDLFRYISSLSA